MRSLSSISALFIIVIGCAGCFQSSKIESPQANAGNGSLAVLAATPTKPSSNQAEPEPPPTAMLVVPATQPPVPPTAPPTTEPAPAEPAPLPAAPDADERGSQPANQPLADNAATTTFLTEGEASRISDNFQGEPMANGQPYNKDALYAAHKELPLGTVVRVTNLNTAISVDVTITDRIPPTTQQVIDVSRAAAVQLGMPDMGIAPVRIELLQ